MLWSIFVTKMSLFSLLSAEAALPGARPRLAPTSSFWLAALAPWWLREPLDEQCRDLVAGGGRFVDGDDVELERSFDDDEALEEILALGVFEDVWVFHLERLVGGKPRAEELVKTARPSREGVCT